MSLISSGSSGDLNDVCADVATDVEVISVVQPVRGRVRELQPQPWLLQPCVQGDLDVNLDEISRIAAQSSSLGYLCSSRENDADTPATHWGLKSAEDVSVYGQGLHAASIGSVSSFTVRATPDLNGKPPSRGFTKLHERANEKECLPVHVAISDAKSGESMSTRIANVDGKGTFRVFYTPVSNSPLRISVKRSDEHVAGSPFLVKVRSCVSKHVTKE